MHQGQSRGQKKERALLAAPFGVARSFQDGPAGPLAVIARIFATLTQSQNGLFCDRFGSRCSQTSGPIAQGRHNPVHG
jgi:hypothetical protein